MTTRKKNRKQRPPPRPAKKPENKIQAATPPSRSPAQKAKTFNVLARQAADCTLCPRMTDQPAVLSRANGSLEARVLFVAEAPGRFGSGRTGIPFYGDKSGDNFQELIDHIGLSRKVIFITNAVLCNPLADGVNSRPTAREMNHCSGFLQATIDLIQPRLVVTLGGVGLDAVNRLLDTRYRLSEQAARLIATPAFTLLPLYHPSPRVANWRRPLALQKKDFQLILKALKKPA